MFRSDRTVQLHVSPPRSDNDEDAPRIELAAWPVPRRRDWLDWVNTPQTAAEQEALERAIHSNRPYGDPQWAARTQQRLAIPPPAKRGRPKKRQA